VTIHAIRRGHPYPSTIGVTGAAGFVGANLVERLLAAGSTVIGVDDMSTGTMANVAHLQSDDAFTLHEFDCRDEHRLFDAFAQCDAIVHLAAMKIPRYGGALKTMQVNVDGAHAAYEVALKTGAHVVLASTSDVYGNAPAPFDEDGPVVHGPPTSRRWSYATSKLYDEHLALRLAEEQDLKVTILRLFNAYGRFNHPTWWGGPLSVFIETLMDGGTLEIHGDGQQSRSFTYVSDTVDGFCRALEHPESAGEIINIGASTPITILELAQKVQTALEIDGPLLATMTPLEGIGGNYQDVVYRVPATEKAKRILGFEAQVGLDEGIALTIEYIRERRAAEARAAEAAIAAA
jgi:UDP-glucose 4-epimerase